MNGKNYNNNKTINTTARTIEIPIETGKSTANGNPRRKGEEAGVEERQEKHSPGIHKDSALTIRTPKQGIMLRRPKDPRNLSFPENKGANRNRQIAIKTPLRSSGRSTLKGPPVERAPPRLSSKKGLGKNSETLPGRQASTARVSVPRSYDIHSRLKAKSPWFQSIIKPIEGGGTKIPDNTGTDTGTYQHVQNVTVAVNANGISGLRICSPYINSYRGHSGIGNTQGVNYQITAPGSSTNADLSWGNGDNATPGEGISFSKIPALMKAEALAHRIVSASVTCQTETSTLNDAGEIIAFVKPFECNDAHVGYNQYTDQWDTTIIPVNKHTPVQACWYPTQTGFHWFNGLDTDKTGEEDFISYQDFTDPNADYGEDHPRGLIPWEIGVLCSGMAPNTGTVRYRIVVNYEFIPQKMSSMVSVSAPEGDSTEVDLVGTFCADQPMTGPVSQKLASAPPTESTVRAENEPTGLGMLFNVIEEALPMILPIAGKALAML